MSRPNHFKYPLFLFLILVALAAWPASAGALVAPTADGGKVGYLPLNPGVAPQGAPSSAVPATVPSGSPPLKYHGGPVMHSQESFAIFWAPSGYSFPSGYEKAIETYLENIAADSGKSTNVYSVSAQYTDKTGHALYNDSYGGSLADSDAYGATCPEYEGADGAEYTACVTDEKIQEELTSVVEAEGLPNGLGVEYYMVLPPEVGSCFEGSGGPECFDEAFCAYHSYVKSQGLVYANISYSPEDPLGCGVSEYPNGHTNGNADDTFSSLSHEANESITDPTLEAWFDSQGFEDGDECRNTPFGEDFGAPLGGSAGTLFNESINGAHYYLQQEWSNDINNCAQRVGPAKPAIANPGTVVPGQSVEFSGAGTVPGDGGIVSYEWEFGDGGTGSGIHPLHTYAAVGSYTVTLTVTDDGSFTYSTSRKVEVTSPEEGKEEGGGGKPGPTPSPSPTPTPSPTPQPIVPGLAVAGAKAKVKNGVVLLKLTCKGGPCAGVVKLLDRGVIGHARFNLAAGKSVTLHIKLTRAGITLLSKAAGALKVNLSGTGVRHRGVSLTPAG